MPLTDEEKVKRREYYEENKAYWRKWYANNKSKIKESAKRSVQKRKAQDLSAFRKQYAEYQKNYRERLKAKMTDEERALERQKNRERNARYREKHREQYRKSVRERARKYYAANPAKFIGIQHSKRAIKARGKVTAADWRAIKAAYEGHCAYCDKPFAKLEMDHVVALTKGGRHVPSNVRPACRKCNAGKGNRTVPPLPPRYPELMPKDHEE